MENQDKFTLLIRKSEAFTCLLVDDRSHKRTSLNCWCFRNSASYNAAPWLQEVFLIMRFNSARKPDVRTALLITLFDPSLLLDTISLCSVAPRMWHEVTRQRPHDTLWQDLIFLVPWMDLVAFQMTKRFKMLRRIWSTFDKRCKRKKVLEYFITSVSF